MPAKNSSLDHAYAVCIRVARRHYENFPVASWLLPRRMRPHIAAVYAFARYADDLADEGVQRPADRHRALDAWMIRLRMSLDRTNDAGEDAPEDDVICRALAATIRDRELPVSLFEDLISAFRQDVTVHRYDSWDELLDYCRRSANPVGRLVLRIAGYRDAELDRASDDICSALQLTNFLQDFEVDWRRGRLYIPSDISREHGATEQELRAPELSNAWKIAVADTAVRTRRMFESGRELCDAVGGRLALELRLTWLGGRQILDRLEMNGYDPRARRPTLGWSEALPLAWKTAIWRKRP